MDGFESYNDIPTGEEDSRLVYAIWSDGLVDPSKGGSQIGYFTDTSLETNIVHGGRQSLPLTYNNRSASVSEVTVDPAKLPIGRDWTKGAPETLVLWFYGQSGNAVTEKMYVNVGSVKVPYPGNAADVTRPIWKQWNVDLAALGIDLSNVGQHGISFERTEATGGAGTIFIDDILLYRSAPAMADGGPNARFDVAKLARWREMSTQAMFVAAAMCGISSDGTAAPVMSPAEIRLTGD